MKKEEWFFGYGSLIFNPVYKGQKLEDWCEPPVDGSIDKGIEFLHPSLTRGGAPTLCFDGTKRKILGKVWRALGEENIKGALLYMRKREGKITEIKVKLANDGTVSAWSGDTSSNLKGKSPKEIAKLAVESEWKVGSRGGVSYIKKAMFPWVHRVNIIHTPRLRKSLLYSLSASFFSKTSFIYVSKTALDFQFD